MKNLQAEKGKIVQIKPLKGFCFVLFYHASN